MIVGNILDYIVKNKERIYLDLDQQLLIYIKSKEEVGKNKVVKTIEIGFILLGRRKKLIISALTGFITNGINKSMVYTALKVNNWMGKNYRVKINSQ